MKNLSRKEKRGLKIFLDSSVIIAAILSATGGSFRLILESRSQHYNLLISPYILEECFRILKLKYPQKTFLLPMIINSFPFQMVEDATETEVKKYLKIISPEDAPILACAIKNKTNYLITLDKKDFFRPAVLKLAKKYNLFILTPKDFFDRIELPIK